MAKYIRYAIILILFLPGLILMLVDEYLGLDLDIKNDIKETHPCLIAFITAFWIWILNLI